MTEKVIDERFIIDSGKECIKHCPFETIRPKMKITGEAVMKLRYLQDKYKDLDVEWLVYGNATKVEGERFSWILEEVTIPVQKVRTAEVKDIKTEGLPNTVVHKHPNESTRHSDTDDDFVDSNHDFSIVIGENNKFKNITGVASIQIECGRYMKLPLDVDIVVPSSKDINFIKSTENIKVVMDGQSLFSGVMGKAKTCKRCKKPLEKINDEYICHNCSIVYVDK